jgi:hypothetical protein
MADEDLHKLDYHPPPPPRPMFRVSWFLHLVLLIVAAPVAIVGLGMFMAGIAGINTSNFKQSLLIVPGTVLFYLVHWLSRFNRR